MLDTTPKLAQCQKCQAYVFQAQVNGYTVLVDPAALQGPELTLAALSEGKALYSKAHGKLKPSKNPLTGAHLAAHGCTVTGTVRADKVEVVPQDPQRAPVTPGRLQGGFPRAHALADGSQGHRWLQGPPPIIAEWEASRSRPHSVVTPANHPPSDLRELRYTKPTRCDICRKLITTESTGVSTIEYDGRLIYGVHEQC